MLIIRFPGPDEEFSSTRRTGIEDSIGFSIAHGAAFAESNIGSAAVFSQTPDPTVWSGKAVAGLLETQAKRRGRKPLMTRFTFYNPARNNDFDSSKARKELGYTTRSHRETIRNMLQWLKEIGKSA